MKQPVTLSLLLLACGLAATAASHDIIQRDKQFTQSEITIKVGDSVNFRNKDTVTHHLFTSSKDFRFNFMESEDEDKLVKFPVKGDFDVRCAIHPNMRLMVHVVP